jgi:hypothetical protein
MTTHASEEQLVLHFYGESAGGEWIDAHLATCEACRHVYRDLQAMLNLLDCAPVPERDATYGELVWGRIRRSVPLPASRQGASLFRRFGLAAAVAGLMVCAYQAGRLTPSAPEPQPPALSSMEARHRVLLVAMSDHLERARIVLVELRNAPRASAIDISQERGMAEDLVATNRLLRASADRTGETAMTSLLDELERVLLEAARSPETLSALQTAEILFKMRVFDEGMRQPERETL